MTTAAASRADALLQTLRAGGGLPDPVRVATLTQLEGGWSRHSYAAAVVDGAGAERDLIVRVRPADTILDTDLGNEVRIYGLLGDRPLPVPALYGYEPSEDTPFGGPFFVMERIRGDPVNVWRGRDRELLEADWHGERGIARDLVDYLATIHTTSLYGVDASIEAREFAATVDRWERMFEEVRLVRDPVVDEAFAWVRSRAPKTVAARLVHGDYRIGNCLVGGGRITGVLDWELAYVGDPRFDLGYLSQRYQAGKLVRAGSELVGGVAEESWLHARYVERTGLPVDAEAVCTYAALGALMHIALMSTGIRVYARGTTDDIRLAWSRFVLPGLRQDLVRLMGW